MVEEKRIPEGYRRVVVSAVLPEDKIDLFKDGVRAAGFLAGVGGEEQDHGGVVFQVEKSPQDGTTVFEPLK